MKKEDILSECYRKAIECLRACSTEHGLFASGGKKGYKGVWARDSMITLIGASTIKDKSIQEQFKKSLISLISCFNFSACFFFPTRFRT